MTRGALGEQLAAEFLQAQGYTIEARNFRTRFGEIDLIARDGKYTVFAEVKLRKNARFGTPREAVTPSKQQKLILAAEAWLSTHPEANYARFDVIEILLPAGQNAAAEIAHFQNAFEA